jgi:ribosome-associated protein
MLKITDELRIDDRYIDYDFVRASGPGGQHVNKAATAVQLRFDAVNAPLPETVRERLTELAGHRMTQDGVLILDANRHRSQARNRKDARRRLVALLRKAARKPKRRRETNPPKSANERRLQNKHHRSRIKDLRKPPKIRRY